MARNKERRKVSHIEFVSAGLLNDVDVEFTNCRFMRWTYPNSSQEITVFAIDAVVEGDEEATELTWSVGGDDDFMPSDDGMWLEANGDRNSLAKNSKYQALIASFRDRGMDDEALEKFGESADYLDGVKAHIMRMPYKGFSGAGRSNNVRRRGAEETEQRENEVVVVSEFHSFPWDKKGGGKKSTSSASSKSKDKAKAKDNDADAGDSDKGTGKGGGDDHESMASKTVLKVLMDAKGNTMDFDDLVVECFQNVPSTDKAERKAIMTLINDRKFVAGVKGVEVDGDTVSL